LPKFSRFYLKESHLATKIWLWKNISRPTTKPSRPDLPSESGSSNDQCSQVFQIIISSNEHMTCQASLHNFLLIVQNFEITPSDSKESFRSSSTCF